MVDLKKEIKLSDLMPRRKPKAGATKTVSSRKDGCSAAPRSASSSA